MYAIHVACILGVKCVCHACNLYAICVGYIVKCSMCVMCEFIYVWNVPEAICGYKYGCE